MNIQQITFVDSVKTSCETTFTLQQSVYSIYRFFVEIKHYNAMLIPCNILLIRIIFLFQSKPIPFKDSVCDRDGFTPVNLSRKSVTKLQVIFAVFLYNSVNVAQRKDFHPNSNWERWPNRRLIILVSS